MSRLSDFLINSRVMASKAVKGLSNTPNIQKPIGNSLSAEDLKARFDAQSEYAASKVNELATLADTELDTKVDKMPDGTNKLIGTDNKITTTYLPSSLMGKLAYGGTFNGDGIITASEKATNLNGLVIDGIPVADYESFYFVCSETHILMDGVGEDAQEIGTFNNGDMAICNGNSIPRWSKVDNTDEVTSVNGKVGAVNLTAVDVGAVSKINNKTGDVTLTKDDLGALASDFSALTDKPLLVDDDTLAIQDSASNSTPKANKKTAFSAIKAWIKSWITKADVGLDLVSNETYRDLSNVDNLKQVATTTDQSISGTKKFIDTVYAEKIQGRNRLVITKATTTYDGVTFTPLSKTRFELNGTPTLLYNWRFAELTNILTDIQGATVTISIRINSGAHSGSLFGIFINNSETVYGFEDNKVTIPMPANLNNIAIAIRPGSSYNNLDVSMQIERGTTATPYTPYIGEFFPTYDKVIRTQAEFEALIASSSWFNAKSVAFIGQFTLSTANNSGVKIPQTVKQIHGFNSAKITITNFVYNATTAKGGLWYATRPTTLDYSIRDLAVDCTGTVGYGFNNCTNLTNCTGTGRGTESTGYGFSDCTNLTNCTGTGTATGTYGIGFGYCTNLTNCTGRGTGTGASVYGFYTCENLTNCTGRGIGIGTGNGYGFYSITYASNCRDGGFSTDMWGGDNTNIDLDTCCKTPITANNATLNA